jgi:DnaK suppressor protein
MDDQEARQLLRGERVRLQALLDETLADGAEGRAAADEPGDMSDSAEPLTGQEADDAVAASLRGRLDAIARAEQRLDQGTFGRSVRSGEPIPDERLRADPAAELTVDEARQES